MKKTNIILLTNIPLIKNLLTEILEKKNFQIIAITDSIRSVNEVLNQGKIPDIILIYTYPSDLCVSHAAAIHENMQGLVYVVLGEFPDVDTFLQGLSVGIRGWMNSNVNISCIESTIEIVAQGGISICFPESQKIFENIVEKRLQVTTTEILEPTFFNGYESAEIARIDLTPRELEVLTLIAEGTSNKTISEMLFISENTVKTHVRNILSKLQFQSRTQVALYAVQHGILSNK